MKASIVILCVVAVAFGGCVTVAPEPSDRYEYDYYEADSYTDNERPPASKVERLKSDAVAFFDEFCAQRGLVLDARTCRKEFLKAWAKESVNSGSELSRDGFEKLDEYMKKGSKKVGEKWGEYYRDFKRGTKKGYRKK